MVEIIFPKTKKTSSVKKRFFVPGAGIETFQFDVFFLTPKNVTKTNVKLINSMIYEYKSNA